MIMGIVGLIDSLAKSEQIDSAVIKAIIEQESNWNPYALRYEPNWTYLLDPPKFASQIDVTLLTERETQKMSWGLGQIMGSVLRELGFVGHMGLMFEPKEHIPYIFLFVKRLQKTAKTLEELFSCYNGGPGALLKVKDGELPNQEYVDSCMKYYKKYRRTYDK